MNIDAKGMYYKELNERIHQAAREGKEIKMKGKFVKSFYRVPIAEECRVFENLGRVKQKNDNRWEWWRWPSIFHSDWKKENKQGVCEIKKEAVKNVLDGWIKSNKK